MNFTQQHFPKEAPLADRFCKAYDELRNYDKSTQRGQKKSLKDQRIDYMIKTEKLTAALMTA